MSQVLKNLASLVQWNYNFLNEIYKKKHFEVLGAGNHNTLSTLIKIT